MPDQCSDRIFISYSRKDGAKFAACLRKQLEAKDLSVWQDLVALEPGPYWWSQIENAIRSKALEHFVLVVTPAALDSDYVRREIRLARQEGKTVSPVKGPGLGDLNNLPRWIGQLCDLDLTEHRTRLIRVLQGPSTQKRVAMMAPKPPADFVQRMTTRSGCGTRPRAPRPPASKGTPAGSRLALPAGQPDLPAHHGTCKRRRRDDENEMLQRL
jgi:TIR domain